MNPRILKEILDDKRVQWLITLAIEIEKQSPGGDIIELMKSELRQPGKEGPSWKQLEFKI